MKIKIFCGRKLLEGSTEAHPQCFVSSNDSQERDTWPSLDWSGGHSEGCEPSAEYIDPQEKGTRQKKEGILGGRGSLVIGIDWEILVYL